MSAGSRLASSVVLAFLFAFGVAACTDDFDSLFEKGRADAATGSNDGGGASGNDGGTSSDPCSNAAACTCNAGATCKKTCDADGTCNATANGGDLTYACDEHVDSCDVQCNGRSSCDVRCDAEGSCSMSCGENASCVLRCTGRAKSCTLTCDDAQKKDCGNGVFTCSPSCP